MKTIIALLILAGITLGLAACNTVEGVGKDTKAAGQSIQNSAEEHK